MAVILLMILSFPVASERSMESNESVPWYENWTLDSDRNWIDDRLEAEMERDGRTGEYAIFVDYLDPTTDADVAYLLQLGLHINYISSYMPTIAAEGASYEDVSHLSTLPGIVMVEGDFPIVRLLDTSSPGAKARPSGIYSPETAWDEGYTGTDIVIAILDTGVDDNHESLDGKFVAGVDVSREYSIEGNPDDGNGHGSHCAGIAMGNGGATDDDGDSEPDYQGTAPDALLVDVKIGTEIGGNLGNAIVRGIEWCRDNKDGYDIRVLSISFGSTQGSDGQDATSRAANEAVLEDGLIIVAAAGNAGPNNDGIPPPASADEVITVGSVDNNESIPRGDDYIADSSNRGPREDDGDEDRIDELKPDLCAPGVSIMSVRYSEIGQGNPNIQGEYVESSGTSMACPHITGIIALMLDANPDLSPMEVKQLLRKTAERRGEPYDPELDKHYSREYGWGIVDAYKVIRAVLGDLPLEDGVEIELTEPLDGTTVSGNVRILGVVETEGNVTIEKVTVQIEDRWRDAKGTESWSYSWDSWEVENGNYTITAEVMANNGSLTSSTSIRITVNNTGERPDDDSGGFLDFEDLTNLDETTLPIIGAMVAVIVIVTITLILRKRRRDEFVSDEDFDYEYDPEEEEEEDYRI